MSEKGIVQIVADNNPLIEKENLLERFINPDRFIEFKVVWLDDNNNMQVNKGYRVQYNNAIGPYNTQVYVSSNKAPTKSVGLKTSVNGLTRQSFSDSLRKIYKEGSKKS